MTVITHRNFYRNPLLYKQVAYLSQRDHAAWWDSFGQKWKTGTGRQYFADIIGLSSFFNHCDVIGQQSYQIRWKKECKRGHYAFKVI